jgi:hypothetical protein
MIVQYLPNNNETASVSPKILPTKQPPSLAYATCTGSSQQEPGMLVVEQV